MNTVKNTAVVIGILLSSVFASAQDQFAVRHNMGMGFFGVINHRIQFDSSGTEIDYRVDGGQNTLFAVNRFSVDLDFNARHKVSFLYQPLELKTEEVLRKDMVVDKLLFPEGTPVKFTYGFPFYRISYLYDFLGDEKRELAAGISMQIRNATISFESADGKLLRTTRDVGPVPILKFRHTLPLGDIFWWGSDIDGFYAPVSYLNGSDEDVVGAILDASVRGGVNIRERGKMFLNLRYIGGGAVGTSKDEFDLGDGYVNNWLHFMTVSLGASYNIF